MVMALSSGSDGRGGAAPSIPDWAPNEHHYAEDSLLPERVNISLTQTQHKGKGKAVEKSLTTCLVYVTTLLLNYIGTSKGSVGSASD